MQFDCGRNREPTHTLYTTIQLYLGLHVEPYRWRVFAVAFVAHFPSTYSSNGQSNFSLPVLLYCILCLYVYSTSVCDISSQCPSVLYLERASTNGVLTGCACIPTWSLG
ncbi:hypothetical protein V3C99_018876 [Haemonchus contortus]